MFRALYRHRRQIRVLNGDSMKNLFLIVTLALTQSCSWFESDYDKLMNPIKKIKLTEKKAGKPNPVFDGVVEPDFPDEKENNKTLEGVDSNHDGVRDDIEIWINRTAEDQYVRWAMKDYYKKALIMYKSFQDNQTELVIHKARAEMSDVAVCVSVLLVPYEKEFIKKYNREPREMNSHKLIYLIINSPLRSKLDSMYESYQINGALGGDPDYCKKTLIGNRFIEILKAN